MLFNSQDGDSLLINGDSMRLDPRLPSLRSNPASLPDEPLSASQESVQSSDDPSLQMKRAQVLMHTFEQVRTRLEEAYRRYENREL
jgi:hypothetical protein